MGKRKGSGPLRSATQLGAAGASLCALLGCREPVPPVAPAPPATSTVAPVATNNPPPNNEEPDAAAALSPPIGLAPPRPLRRCFDELPVWAEAAVADLLDRATAHFETGDAAGALACAEEAARQAPRSIEAHHDRAAALLRVGRVDDALYAVTLVLAMAPHDAQSLELAADIFINHLPASAERATIGLEYAVRGQRVAARQRARLARLWLLEGQALIDLGRASQALRPLERAAGALTPETANAARYELGVALFELGRFEEARQRLAAVLMSDPNHAHARFHMGLVLERAGELALADEAFAQATAADPEAFPRMPDVPPEAFAERVRQAVAGLPSPLQESLRDIPVETAELPLLDDLIAQNPPLSPTILGLFRGLPLGQEADSDTARTKSGRVGHGRLTGPGTSAAGVPSVYAIPERAIVLYRRNLLRSVSNESELAAAISRTLLHEVGHLLGEDDGSLRDRGLE